MVIKRFKLYEVYVFISLIAYFIFSYIRLRFGIGWAVYLLYPILLSSLFVCRFKIKPISIISVISICIAGTVFIFLGYVGLNIDKIARLLLFILTLFYVSWTLRFQTAYYYAILVISFLFISDVVFYGVVNGFNVSSLNIMLFSSSVNTLSAICILLGILHSFSSYNNGKRPSLIILSILFLITIPMYGRLGILLSFFVLSLSLLVNSDGKLKIERLILVLLISLLSVVVFFEQLVLIYEASKFASKSVDSPRWEMWHSYINAMDLKGFLFGVGYECCSTIRYYDDNPHNSFINLHHTYGLLPLLCILLLAIISLWRGSIYYRVLLLIVLLRLSFDKIALFSYFDIFLVYSLLCCYYSRNVFLRKVKYEKNSIV